MATSPKDDALLLDACRLAMNDPGSALRWHAVFDRYTDCDNPALRQQALALLADGAGLRGVAGFLRATCLAGLTGEARYWEQAGELALGIVPVDAERILTFAYLVWAQALYVGGSVAALTGQMTQYRVPHLVAALGAHLAQTLGAMPARPVTAVNKVAIVLPLFGNAGHPPTVLALAQAKLLQRAGCELHLFSCQEPVIDGMAHRLGQPHRVDSPTADLQSMQELTPAGVLATVADTNYSLMWRLSVIHEKIVRFDPDLVLFVGLFSPLMAPLFLSRPVLALGVHAAPSMAPADVWLSADLAQAGVRSSCWSHCFAAPLGHYHPFRVAAPVASGQQLREQWQVGPSQLVLLVVGNRLGVELCGDWANRMVALLAQHRQLVLLVVGGSGQPPPGLAGIAPAQLRVMAFHSGIADVMANSDIYVNPPRLGGGFSVAEAMALGLPVLALAGSDGGSKLGPRAMPDLDAYFAELEALIGDPARRAALGAAMREQFGQTLDLDRSAPSLLAAAGTAVALYHERTGMFRPQAAATS